MFKKLATKFFVDFDYSLLDNLPEITHTYGDPQPDPTESQWMTYTKPDRASEIPDGCISFSGKTKYFLPQFTDDVIDRLTYYFGSEIKWNADRIRLLRTRGFVLPHVDEVRNSCINIGLRNSSSSITKFSKSNLITDFSAPFNTENFICQDGDAYLLNVKNMHAVYPLEDKDRLLITYAFEYPYDKLLSLIRYNKSLT